MKDYYQVLGIEPSADAESIRRAYVARMRIVHPDRFDRSKDERNWEEANRLSAELNEAYAVLGDAALRARYDAGRIDSPSRPQEERHSAAPKRESRKPDGISVPIGELVAGRARFANLPGRTKERLVARQSQIIDEQARIPLGGIGWNIASIAALIVLWGGYLVFAIDQPTWSDRRTTTYFGAGFIVAILVAYNISSIRDWKLSVLKRFLYVTPLYLIETNLDSVRFWPIWSIKQFKATHVHRNWSYDHTDLHVSFGDEVESWSFRARKAFDKFSNKLDEFNRALAQHFAKGDNKYFLENDDFRGFDRSISLTEGRKHSTFWYYVLAIVFSIGSVLLAGSENETRAKDRWYRHPADNQTRPASRTRAPANLSDLGIRPGRLAVTSSPDAEKIPRQPLPDHGRIRRFYVDPPVAPLRIETKSTGTNYLMKLSDWDTDEPVLTAFIVGGLPLEIDVPLGTYRLKYAAGSAWYGDEYLFGERTTYAQATSPFEFKRTSTHVTGYTVELYLQQGGNLTTRPIPAESF